MAITAADLQVKLSTTGADSVKRDLQGIGTSVDQAGQKGRSFGETMRSALLFTGAGAVIGAGAGIVALGKSWVMGASDLAEAQSKVNTVYGQSANVINKWAKTTAKAFGITETSALDTAGTMGNLFTHMGFTTDQAGSMSMGITELSADMASFNNVSQPQVIDALTSAFVGEYDALQRLGVNISAASVEQYALNNGIWDGVGAMTDAERATAVYGLTMEQTSTQQGDFARTSTGMANQLRILQVSFSELGARIGTVFLPAATAMVGWAIDAVDWLGRLTDTFGAGGFGAVVDSIAGDIASLVSGIVVNIPSLAVNILGWIVTSAMSIWEAIEDFIMGGADNGMSGDGTGGARPAFDQSIGEVGLTIAGWVVSSTVDIADAILKHVTPVVMELAEWTMEVGAPTVTLKGWTAAEVIADKLREEVVVPLTGVTIQLDGAEIVAGAFDLPGSIREFVTSTPMQAIAIGAGLVTIALVGAPLVILAGLAAAITKAAIETMPESVVIAGTELGISIVAFSIELANLLADISAAVILEVGGFVLGGLSIGIEIGTATIDVGFDILSLIAQGIAALIGDAIDIGNIALLVSGVDFQFPDIDPVQIVQDWLPDSIDWSVFINILPDFLFPDGSPAEDPVNPGLEPEPVPEPVTQSWIAYGNALDLVVGASGRAKDALTGIFSGDGGRGAGGGSAGPVLGNITAVQTALTSLIAFAQQATSAMTSGMAQMRAAVTAGMAGVTSAVVSGMATSRAAAVSGIASMVASMNAGMAAFRAAVTSGMAGAVAAVRSGIAAMVAAASAGRGQMMSAGLGIGAALGQGIAAGIRGQIGAVAAAAAALVSAAVSAARSAGAISSPSRVMQEQVGQMLGLGAAIGVEDMYPRMDAAMAGLIRTPTAPLIAGGGLNQGGGGGGVNVTVIVQGSLVTERELREGIVRDVADGLRSEIVRHRTAVLGVPQ